MGAVLFQNPFMRLVSDSCSVRRSRSEFSDLPPEAPNLRIGTSYCPKSLDCGPLWVQS